MNRCPMKVEVEKFYNGNLKVKIVFEPSSNFWIKDLTWVPTEKEIELILLTYLGIDGLNKLLRKYRRNRPS